MSKNCLICGEIFFNKRKSSNGYFVNKYTKAAWKNAKFCSQKCYQIYWLNVILEKIKKKDSRIKIKCKVCKKEFLDWKTNNRKYCSRKCKGKYLAIAFLGEKSVRWQGGITPIINKRCNSAWWIKLRREIYARDNYTCQICGVKCEGKPKDIMRKIQCDHILKERLGGSHEMTNLQTLCLGCHIQKDWRKSIIKENYM